MKKMTVHGWILWAIALTVTAVLAFLIPFERSTIYWLALVCTGLMFVLSALVFYQSSLRDNTLESRILGWPILRVALSAIAVQVVVGFILMALAPWCPLWAAILAEVVVFAATFALLTVRDAARAVVQVSEQAVRDRTGAWKAIRLRASQVAAETGHTEIRKLAEDIRYSDPVPTELDTQMAQILEELSSNASTENLQKARQLLDRRNALAKAGK